MPYIPDAPPNASVIRHAPGLDNADKPLCRANTAADVYIDPGAPTCSVCLHILRGSFAKYANACQRDVRAQVAFEIAQHAAQVAANDALQWKRTAMLATRLDVTPNTPTEDRNA